MSGASILGASVLVIFSGLAVNASFGQGTVGTKRLFAGVILPESSPAAVSDQKEPQKRRDSGRYGVELIKNRGCEKRLGPKGRIPDWIQKRGKWHRGKKGTKAASGRSYFSASKRKT